MGGQEVKARKREDWRPEIECCRGIWRRQIRTKRKRECGEKGKARNLAEERSEDQQTTVVKRDDCGGWKKKLMEVK